MQTKENSREDIYNLYYNKVFGYVMNRVHSKADADDITSDVFLKIFSKSDEFDLNRTGASTYVFRVMQTTLTDFYRKNRIIFVSMDEAADKTAESENTDDELASLNEALAALTDREQSIIILHYYHGLSHKEIAQKMNLSYGNVRQLCHVALNKLRKEMQ